MLLTIIPGIEMLSKRNPFICSERLLWPITGFEPDSQSLDFESCVQVSVSECVECQPVHAKWYEPLYNLCGNQQAVAYSKMNRILPQQPAALNVLDRFPNLRVLFSS